jgi:general secretion pathway protein L
MPTLILALPLTKPTAATEFDFVLSSPARPLMDHGSAPLALLPAADTVVLVAPAPALSWHRVRLPPVATNRMRAALAGLLEEHLLDDPAQLAFALAPGRTADGEALVVVCDKAWLQSALELFEQAQRPVSRVVPAYAPEGPDTQAVQLHVIGSAEEDASVVVVDAQGATCLPLASAQSVFADRTLPQGALFAEPAVAALAEQKLGRAVTVVPAAQQLLQASRCEWELTQFDLSIGGSGRLARRWQHLARQLAFAPAWRPARWGLLCLLLVQLVGINAWAWKLDAAVRDKQQRVNALLTQTFPGVRTVVDAPLQMQRALALLRQASGGIAPEDLEVMLAALGAAMPDGGAPLGIDFAPGELSVRGLALVQAERDRLQDQLQEQGYQLRVENDRLLVRRQGRP